MVQQASLRSSFKNTYEVVNHQISPSTYSPEYEFCLCPRPSSPLPTFLPSLTLENKNTVLESRLCRPKKFCTKQRNVVENRK